MPGVCAEIWRLPNRERGQVALHLAAQQQLPPDHLGRLEVQTRGAMATKAVRSLRDAQRVVIQQYVKNLLGAPSAGANRKPAAELDSAHQRRDGRNFIAARNHSFTPLAGFAAGFIGAERVRC